MSLDLANPPQITGYLLLFRNTQWYDAEYSREDLQQIMDSVTTWFARLENEGKFVTGQPLNERAAIISGENGRSVTDGPFAEAKEAIGGYVKLFARDLEEATAIVQQHPGLQYGLVIEIRELTMNCHLGVTARPAASVVR